MYKTDSKKRIHSVAKHKSINNILYDCVKHKERVKNANHLVVMF